MIPINICHLNVHDVVIVIAPEAEIETAQPVIITVTIAAVVRRGHVNQPNRLPMPAAKRHRNVTTMRNAIVIPTGIENAIVSAIVTVTVTGIVTVIAIVIANTAPDIEKDVHFTQS